MKFRLRVLILLITIFFKFSITESSAQGLYLQKGESGYGLEIGFAKNRGAESLIGSFGYSYKGKLDINVLLENSRIDSFIEDVGAIAFGIGPVLTYHVLKQQKDTVLSMTFFGGLGFGFFSGNAFKYLDNLNSVTSTSLISGFRIYSTETITSDFFIVPAASIGYIYSKIRIRREFSKPRKTISDKILIGNLSLNLCIEMGSGIIFVISPEISQSNLFERNQLLSYSIRMGLVIPGKQNRD